MTVLPKRFLAKFLKGEVSESERAELAERLDADLSDEKDTGTIGVLLMEYENAKVTVTKEDMEDLVEAKKVASDAGNTVFAEKIQETIDRYITPKLGMGGRRKTRRRKAARRKTRMAKKSRRTYK